MFPKTDLMESSIEEKACEISDQKIETPDFKSEAEESVAERGSPSGTIKKDIRISKYQLKPPYSSQKIKQKFGR